MYYTVQMYDTLGSIALRFCIPIKAIIRANRMCRYFVYPGQVLLIPIKPGHPQYVQQPQPQYVYPTQPSHGGGVVSPPSYVPLI